MTMPLAESLQRLRLELARNPRLRIGAVVIAAILGVYGWMALLDWREALHDRYVERREYLRKVRAVAGQDQWSARATAMAEARKTLEAAIPSAASVGLAQATVQGWVRDTVAVHGDAVRVESMAPEPVEAEPGLYRVPMNVAGSLPPRAVLSLVQQLENRPTVTMVERLLLVNRRNQTFEMTIVALVKVESADAPA